MAGHCSDLSCTSTSSLSALQSLDLEDNLLSDWAEVMHISQLPCLRHLWLGGNELQHIQLPPGMSSTTILTDVACTSSATHFRKTCAEPHIEHHLMLYSQVQQTKCQSSSALEALLLYYQADLIFRKVQLYPLMQAVVLFHFCTQSCCATTS